MNVAPLQVDTLGWKEHVFVLQVKSVTLQVESLPLQVEIARLQVDTLGLQ